MFNLSKSRNVLQSLKYAAWPKHASNTSSASASVTDAKEEHEEIVSQASKKLQPRLPLAKNFFVGLVDKELLAYPEVITRDDMAQLQNDLKPLQDYFTVNKFKEDINSIATLAKDLQNLDIYGLNISRDFDGKGWNFSASLMATEPECQGSVDVAFSLLPHRSIVDALQEKGTPEQQQKYLTKLAKGSLVAREAIYELDAPDYSLFHTKAFYDATNQNWCLNGSKTLVVAPPKAAEASQLFLVLAQTSRYSEQVESDQASTTAFLVDSNVPGVRIHERVETFGCRSSTMQTVTFDNVNLKENCILGLPHEGKFVGEFLQQSNRLRNALVALGLSKNILNYLTNFCIETKKMGVTLKDMEFAQTHLAKATLSLYGVESMIYMTAGLLDEFQNPDVILETAITKYFSLKELLNLSISLLDLKGPKALLTGEMTERYLRDAMQLYVYGESITMLNAFIALVGLQHVGSVIGDNIRKQRNPLFYPGHILSKFMERSSIDNPITNMELHENLHPSLQPASMCLEQSVARLQMCCDLLLTRHGTGIVECHNEFCRIADMVSILYCIFSSLARASRSYCIGLYLADHELLTATAICQDGFQKVKTLATEIFNGQYVNNDRNVHRLSQQIIKSKGYFAEHPLKYNF
ncbi:complex I assembly factor ACAD9, mitochondrial-like [Glossina fuscipes]|uniref:Complex I assembly factor ACAD9, mitochondrial-like n=1 Tax=Glossina fuscipes TaxID=7396 RepID=A0A9C6E198_9MUSC|nr:complex I assembly factor ACAD9, mitochondrial-like [Glossina fuscipes]XP_037899837.1 complex I assembly factor ACAD9, mitochondrial-like [Glossina fuscipes]